MKFLSNVKGFQVILRRHCTTHELKCVRALTNEEVRKKRNKLFEEEKLRQKELITRVEKIQVEVMGPPEDCTLVMNKDISTPYNCAMHIGEIVTQRAALAMVDGNIWDMHRPLSKDCRVQFLHFKQDDPRQVNKVYWRSCSFLLGLLIERMFREEFYVELHSWPAPNIRSGCFVYDADLKMPNWTPTKDLPSKPYCVNLLKGDHLHNCDYDLAHSFPSSPEGSLLKIENWNGRDLHGLVLSTKYPGTFPKAKRVIETLSVASGASLEGPRRKFFGCVGYIGDEKEELQVFSTTMRKFLAGKHNFERLDVSAELALQMFDDNRFKKEQIPQIAATSPTQNKITLYRLDDHIDISCGPMIASTSLVGMFDLAAIHKIETEAGQLHRFQGVSLPKQLPLNHYAYSVLINRAAKLT